LDHKGAGISVTQLFSPPPRRSSGYPEDHVNRLARRPPAIAIDAALAWVLARAFGPVGACHEPPRSGGEALALAQRLGVAPRIGGRVSADRLRHELGDAASEGFLHEYWSTAAREGALERATTRLGEIARNTGSPLILLKHAALRALRIVGPGLRRASDVDVLVPGCLTWNLHRALLRAGYRPTGARGYEHQLPPLLDPDDVLIEIHRHIPGVHLDSDRLFATADDLLSSGLVRASEGKLVPDSAVLSAHAIAHGFLQNAGAPRGNSPLRVLSDLCDLQERDPSALERAARFMGRGLHADDLAALGVLTKLALAGNLSQAEGGALDLLRHALGSQLDDDYARSLTIRTLTRPLSQHAPWRATLNAAASALFPDWSALESLGGAAPRAHQKALHRLTRPVVLLVRTARAARSEFRP
jgi:hypothetical protein